jgi:hypothetical protein
MTSSRRAVGEQHRAVSRQPPARLLIVGNSGGTVRHAATRRLALLTWKNLPKLRCCPRRAGAIVQTILVSHQVDTSRCAG